MSASHGRVLVETQGGTWINLNHYDIKPDVESPGGSSAIARVSAVAVMNPEHSYLLMERLHPSENEASNASQKVARGIAEAATRQAIISQKDIQVLTKGGQQEQDIYPVVAVPE